MRDLLQIITRLGPSKRQFRGVPTLQLSFSLWVVPEYRTCGPHPPNNDEEYSSAFFLIFLNRSTTQSNLDKFEEGSYDYWSEPFLALRRAPRITLACENSASFRSVFCDNGADNVTSSLFKSKLRILDWNLYASIWFQSLTNFSAIQNCVVTLTLPHVVSRWLIKSQ